MPPSASAFDSALTLPIDTLKALCIQKNSYVHLSALGPNKWYGYKGIMSTYLSELLKRAIKPFVYPFFYEICRSSVFLAGASEGFFDAIVSCPLEVIKNQMQTSAYLFKWDWDCVTYLYKNFGLRAFFLWVGGVFMAILLMGRLAPGDD